MVGSAMMMAALLAAAPGSGAPPIASRHAAPSHATPAAFRPSLEDFPNPERGFYRPTRTDLDDVTPEDARQAYADGFRLLYARINLAPYRGADLPADYLAKLDAGFAAARQAGVKLIVRAVYNYPAGETEYHQAQDAPLPRVLAHLAQLKPLLGRNADVIAFMQAGFIGAWGEWHTSSNGLTAPASRTRIRDALLDAVPTTRFVQFRYPPYLQQWTPQLPALAQALNGGYRIGFHNDCFLASQTDVGTYDEDPARRAGQRAYAAKVGDLAPFGAETCNPRDDANAIPRTTCADIQADGSAFNLTYLNDDYYRPLFHDNWVKQGCMDDVRRRIGYRLALVSASYPASARAGGTLPLRLTVRNDGWARLYNPRGVRLVLQDEASGAVRGIEAVGADPRTWLPGPDHVAALNIALPADLAKGRYRLLLALPDGDARLAADPRYSIRPANADDRDQGRYWDAELGAFALGSVVTIG